MAGETAKVDGETVGLIMAGVTLAGVAWHVFSRVARTERTVEQNAEAVHQLHVEMRTATATLQHHATDIALVKQRDEQVVKLLAKIDQDITDLRRELRGKADRRQA